MHKLPTITRGFDLRATLCLIGATLCWGGVPVMLKYLALPGNIPDGFTTNTVRYPIAAIIYLPWLIIGIKRGKLRGLWLSALIPTAFNLIAQTLWAWAPYHLDAGLLAFLLRLCVVWAVLGAFIVFRDERPLARSPRFWLGASLAIAGFVVMSWQGMTQHGGTSMTGILIIFFCGVGLGLYGVSVRYVMRGLHPLMVFAFVSTYTSIGLLAMAPLGEPSSVLRQDPPVLIVLIASSLTGIAAAHGLYYIAIQRIGVAICSLLLMATPMITALCAYLILGEQLTIIQWLGGFVLLAGSSLAVMAQSHLAPRRPPSAADIPND